MQLLIHKEKVHHKSDTALSIIPTLTRLILTIISKGWYYYYPRLKERKVRLSMTMALAHQHRAGEQQSRGQAVGSSVCVLNPSAIRTGKTEGGKGWEEWSPGMSNDNIKVTKWDCGKKQEPLSLKDSLQSESGAVLARGRKQHVFPETCWGWVRVIQRLYDLHQSCVRMFPSLPLENEARNTHLRRPQ